jgi:hypothetical protein
MKGTRHHEREQCRRNPDGVEVDHTRIREDSPSRIEGWPKPGQRASRAIDLEHARYAYEGRSSALHTAVIRSLRRLTNS